MKNILIILILATIIVTSCSKAEFEEAYPDPSKISFSSVEKQYSGFLQWNKGLCCPKLLELLCCTPDYFKPLYSISSSGLGKCNQSICSRWWGCW